jgi:hypothetical protein
MLHRLSKLRGEGATEIFRKIQKAVGFCQEYSKIGKMNVSKE